MDQPTGAISVAVDAAISFTHAPGLSAQKTRRLVALLRGARSWFEANRISVVADIDPVAAEAFIRGPLDSGEPASVATLHLRRSALRLLFRACRENGLADGDATLDIALPPRVQGSARPLTDDEILVCRGAALGCLTDTRSPAAWALAEATATTAELPLLGRTDLDLETGSVRLPGSSKRDPRVAPLSGWGIEQLQRRLRAVEDPDLALVYAGARGGESAQASTCKAVHQVLVRAGFGSDTDLRPSSVAAWAGSCVWTETGKIDEVARALGVRSLDRAAQIIRWDWRETR